ncbi:MAG TPA: hypothetical protein VFW44_09345 [Bryobacteraceae bacterium]|nr:hypothetical protein [Bryobacteraceae bacterium]
MGIDARELSDFRRRATELMAETSDVPTILRSRLGEQHQLAKDADEMAGSIEDFVRELRSFDIAGQPVDTFEDS